MYQAALDHLQIFQGLSKQDQQVSNIQNIKKEMFLNNK